MATKMIHEILNEVNTVTTDKEKIDALRKNYRNTLGFVLRGMFHPKIKYRYTEIPVYTPLDSPKGFEYSTIDMEIERVYLFEQNNPRRSSNLSDKRMTEIFIQILECLDAREAKVFTNMILKQPMAGLTYDLVVEAFPNLMADE